MRDRRRLWILAMVWLAAAAGGCRTGEIVRQSLGMDGEYLFYGFDAIVLPGKPAEVAVRLQEGTYLQDQEGMLVSLYHDGNFVALSRTDSEGYARMSFTPPAPGDYWLEARLVEGQLDGAPGPAKLLVACRERDHEFIVVDVDRTILPSFFAQFAADDPVGPIEGSVDVLEEASRDATILYLTLRLDYFGPRTKSWLQDNGFPDGPLWVARFHGLLEGNRDFRIRRLRQLRQDFPNVRVGIGDKVSSVVAHLANEMRAILLVQVERMDDPDTCGELADAMRALPDVYEAVGSWEQIRQALVEGKSFPPERMIQDLEQRAAMLEARD